MQSVTVYCMDLAALSLEEAHPFLSDNRLSRIARCVPENKKKQLAAAELLTAYALHNSGVRIKLPLDLAYGAHGKPYLPDCPVSFNASHSGRFVVCAVSELPVGVDVQEMRDADFKKLARKLCSDRELGLLYEKSGVEEKQLFYEIWTRKESKVKLNGAGFSQDLRGVDAFSPYSCSCRLAADTYALSIAAEAVLVPVLQMVTVQALLSALRDLKQNF